jgi:hypothetical protein
MTKNYRMSRSERESLERMKAEDHVLDYLSNRCPTRQQQAAVAIRVEMLLAAKWEIEQRDFWDYVGGRSFVSVVRPERLKEAKNRYFKLMTPGDLNEIKRLFSETAPESSDAAAEQYVLETLSKFHTDRAWWIAHLVRSYLVAQCPREPARVKASFATSPSPLGETESTPATLQPGL